MKVAAYCRVSTDKADQSNSFENQQQYFREYIDCQPDWELYEIYADEGLTGTSTKKRTAFNRMIFDAKSKCFDLIVTKEISRFARNTLDSIHYTRELKKMGVGVLFMNDNMNTLSEQSEFLLTLKASMAQEESRFTSSRVKWGQTRRMEQGVVFGRSMLGYDVKGGKMTINSGGAKIVRLIYQKYVHERKGTTVIARELREAGYKTLTGRTDWRNTVILKILRNEKYCGDLKQKKTITPDYLTHQKKYNHGEEAYVFLKDHHEPIIERELWNEAQREIARRDLDGKHGTGHGNRYPLSGKIKCSECGQSFVSRKRTRRNGSNYKTWRCGTTTAEGKRHTDSAGNKAGCDVGYQIRDEAGMDILRQSVSMLKIDKESIVSRITSIAARAFSLSTYNNQANTDKLKKELAHIEEKKINVMDAFFSSSISKEDMRRMNAEYDRQMTKLSAEISTAEKRDCPSCNTVTLEKEIRAKVTDIVNEKSAADDFYGNLLDHIVAFPDRKMTVTLKFLPIEWTYTAKSLMDTKNCGPL